MATAKFATASSRAKLCAALCEIDEPRKKHFISRRGRFKSRLARPYHATVPRDFADTLQARRLGEFANRGASLSSRCARGEKSISRFVRRIEDSRVTLSLRAASSSRVHSARGAFISQFPRLLEISLLHRDSSVCTVDLTRTYLECPPESSFVRVGKSWYFRWNRLTQRR